MLGFCVFAAACSSQPFSPTAASGVAGVAGAQAQANGGAANVEVTFTKWIPSLSYPGRRHREAMSLEFSPGRFSGDFVDNGTVASSRLGIRSSVGRGHSFVALIEGKQKIRYRRRLFERHGHRRMAGWGPGYM